MDVRCCCDAHLIGWIAVGPFRPGVVYRFARRVAVPFGVPRDGVDLVADVDMIELRCLPVERHGRQAYALQSRDYPIDWLRQIPGFVEATDDDRRRD